MINKLKPKSEFTRNVLTLMTGTTIAQAIPIAISPILTRLYTPEDFGVFALYMSIASVLSVIATGRYELAIMLPEKDEDSVNIVALSILISFFVSFISLLIVFIFNAQITNLLGNTEISSWLYFIPITVLFTGIYQSFNYWSNRKKEYKQLATSRVVQSGITAVSNLGMGFGGLGSGGLILSTIFGQSIATWVLGSKIFKSDFEFFKKSVRRLKIFAVAKKYIKHPKYLIISHGIATIYMQIPIIFIGKVFDLSILGFYSLANRFINLPGSLVATSIGDVFREKATKDYHKYGNFENIFLQTIRKTFFISIIPFMVLYFSVEDIFEFIFGSSWRIAGEYSKILIIGAFVSFVITPIDKAALIVNAIRYIFLWHLFRFIAYIGFTGVSYFYQISIESYLYGIVFINVLFYLIELYMGYDFSKKGKK